MIILCMNLKEMNVGNLNTRIYLIIIVIKYGMTFETNELKVVENIKTDAKNATNYFILNFVSQENDISNILKTCSITNKIGVLRSFIEYCYIFFDKLGHIYCSLQMMIMFTDLDLMKMDVVV